MWPYAIGAVVGAVFASRGRPKADVRQMMTLGPRSGLTYPVEEVREAGLIIARPPNATVCFLRKPDGRFIFYRSQGDPRVIAAVRQDYEAMEIAAKTGE